MEQLTESDLVDSPESRRAEAARKHDSAYKEDIQKSRPDKRSGLRRFSRWGILLIAALIVAGSARWWLDSERYETTDDAQIEGHLDSISTRISGTVTYVNPQVENNQLVEAGTLLMQLDPRDYEAGLEHAKADFDTRNAEALSARVTIPIVGAGAFGQLHSAEAAKQQAMAIVESEQANLVSPQHNLQPDEVINACA